MMALCCPGPTMCRWPRNSWILKLWQEGDGIHFQLSKQLEHFALNCCLRGVVGLMIPERRCAECKQLVRRVY